ncbi:MAG: DcaP family trimeric outer membrane transporter [Cyclobacteriaceae bacterium]|jgi:hypothetical protein
MRYIILFVAMLGLAGAGNGQTPTETTTELPPGWWLIPKTETKIKFGGYVKFDLIHDFKPIGSPDFFDVSKIPTDGAKGQTTHMNAKETRLYLDVRKNSKVGEIRAYAEGDFYGSGGAFRLRHAFVEIGDKWLAGQWWSNFMDENIIPNTLDFEKPAAYAFARHPMFRYRHAITNDAYLAIALEEPSSNAQSPAQSGKFESPLPDVTARYRVTKKWGHLQLSGFGAKMVYRYTSGSTDELYLYGVNLSGQFNLAAQKDKLIYQVVYGPGVGRFRGGLSAGLDANGNLEALTDTGITVGYEHQWSNAFSSLLLYNQGQVNNTEGQPTTSIQTARYAAANLIWHFAPQAFAGVEYLWGLRKDVSEAEGTANRLQISVRYSFN